MTTRRSRGRATAGAIAFLVALSLGGLGVLASRAARPKPTPCPDGRYLLRGEPLLAGVATRTGEALTIGAGRIVLDGACPAIGVKPKATRRGTVVKVRWPACPGVKGAVRLKGRIEPSCQTLTGKLVAKGARRTEDFTAVRSTCGDGVIDAGGGEACDSGTGCAAPAACTDRCACETPGTTPSTVPGTTTTTVTRPPTTSSTSVTTTTSLVVTTSIVTTTSSLPTTTSAPSTTSTSTVTTTSSTTPTTLPTVPGPDPTTVAPPLDPTATTGFAAATAFLFAGPDRVQFNVDAGAIAPVRAAVVRGRVLDSGGTPLAGVLVRVLGHDEFGQGLSRADGAFDMVVNGGGPLTVQYEKGGFLTAQRQVSVPWQDYVALPDVMLCPLDPVGTAIDLAAATEITVAQGTPKTDADGTRQATLLVEPGTAAEMVMPDGSRHALTDITVRATEFTVGSAGPAMMPAVLPPESGYTYAVEFSVDEAMAAGAAMVQFDRPIPTYVENFVGFPVGTPVPAGYYDRVRGVWVAAPNGRVIAVLAETGGLADLDVTGDGVSDTGAVLADLGIDDAERATLATLYAPGQSLWRVPVDHFTPWDYNWPFGPPDDAVPPDEAGASASSDDEPLDGSCEASGSVIECENQVLGEDVDLVGTPYALHYRSDRVPGRIDSLDVRLSGASVPGSLLGIRVRATVAGQTTERSFAPAPNQSTVIPWDGRDAYGRPVQGGQRVTGTIEYEYPAVFKTPSEFGQAFGRFGGPAVSLSGARSGTVTAVMPISAVLREGITDARGLGLGGWTLSVHHFYDPVARVLHLGSGRRRRAESVARVIDVTDVDPFSGGTFSRALALGPDGSFYLFRTGTNTVRRLVPAGIETVIAGGGSPGQPEFGDGGPAVAAEISFTEIVALGPDGSVFILDRNVVRRIGSDGIIRRVAGRYSGAGCGGAGSEGVPATEADLCSPLGLTVAPDGRILIVDFDPTVGIFGVYRVKQVGTDGIITTVAGNAGSCALGEPCGDGGLAAEARFAFLLDTIVVGPDGSVYVADAHRIRRIRPDGIIEAFAGTQGQQGFFGDGGPATDALLCNPRALAIGADGTLIFVDSFGQNIRRIAPDGIISTLAGSATANTCASPAGTVPQTGDRGPARQAGLGQALGLALAPDGEIFVSVSAPAVGNLQRFLIRRIGQPLPGFSAADILVASEDGRLLYAFDPNGRHLLTLDALTAVVEREFGYDAAGRLVRITEKTGGTDNVTTIERNAAGHPTAIVGPFGGRTALAVDGNGFLSAVTNPAGETTTLASSASGLLERLTTANGLTSTFSYDAVGRLLRDEDSTGRSQTLARSGPPEAFTVTRTTALGRRTTYLVETLPNRVLRRTVTAPDGTAAVAVDALDAATRTFGAPDGAAATLVAGPDPRFGVEAPVTTSISVRLPSARELLASNARSAVVSDPFDPLSLVSQTESSTVGGQTDSTVYTAATRTLVGTSPLGRTRTLTLDALGRPVTFQAASLAPATAGYDARGRLASLAVGAGATTRTVTIGYDAQGFVEHLTDPLDRTVRYVWDGAGRAVGKTQPDGRVVGFAWDAAGNLTSVTPPGRPPHTLAYSKRNELLSVTPPAVPGTGPTTYAYDDDGALTGITRPGDEVVTFAYDDAGRLATRTLATGGSTTGVATYAYDAATGHVTSITGPNGVELAYGYDGGLVTSEAWSGPVAGTVAQTVDASLRLAGETVNGTAIAYGYDDDGLLTAAGDLAVARDPETGLLAGTTLGTVADTWTHDGVGDVASYGATAGSTVLYTVTYTRDAVGRVTAKAETVAGVTRTFSYGYDVAGRLVDVRRDGTEVERYEYDANGNRIGAVVDGAAATGTYDDQDRLLSYGNVTYSYSPSGRLATRQRGPATTTYRYDAVGNLLAVTLPGGREIGYLVDGRDRRVGRSVDGTLRQGFLYGDGLRPVAELDATGAVVSRFVYAMGYTPAYLVRGGVRHRIITDQVGSVRLVVNDESGAIVQRLDYDAFGHVVLDTNPGFQPFGFAGGLYDPETTLVRFGARDYDAETGRWTAKDPIGFAGNDANLYRYARSNPVNFIDPTGTAALDLVGGVLEAYMDALLLPFAGIYVVALPFVDEVGFIQEALGVEAFDTESTEFVVGQVCFDVVAGSKGIKGLLSALKGLLKGGGRKAVTAATHEADEVTQVVRRRLNPPRPNRPSLEVTSRESAEAAIAENEAARQAAIEAALDAARRR